MKMMNIMRTKMMKKDENDEINGNDETDENDEHELLFYLLATLQICGSNQHCSCLCCLSVYPSCHIQYRLRILHILNSAMPY